MSAPKIDWRSMFKGVLERMRSSGESNEMGARWMATEADNAVYSILAAKDAEIAKLREALSKAADQLDRVHDDAFRQAGGYGLVSTDGREFSCIELNKCDAAAHSARAALAGGAA